MNVLSQSACLGRYALLGGGLMLSLLPACGRDSFGGFEDLDGGAPSSSNADSGPAATDLAGDILTASSCTYRPANPGIEFDPTCASYVPSLGDGELVHVEEEITGSPGDQVSHHRFRSTEACGFDVVIGLPNLRFVADDQPYHQSKWWLTDANGTSLIATVLWRSSPSEPLLAVATVGNVDVLNLLLAPRSVSLDGPDCTDPGQAGNRSQALEDNGGAVECDDEAGTSNRVCRDGDSVFRMLVYSGSPQSASPAAVIGAQDLLVPIE
jgi:hypothetical protein